MKQMIYCNTFSTFWRKTFLSLFLVGIFPQAFGAASCGQIGPDSNYSKLNEILKCLEDKIDKGSSVKGIASQSNPTEAKKPVAKTSIEKLPVFRAIGSSEYSSSYGAQNVRDGHENSRYWATKNGNTTGAWIELQLDYPCVIEEIAYYIVLGGSAQIRQATLKFDGDSSQTVKFDLPKVHGWQTRPLTPTRAAMVKIIVDDIFPERHSTQIHVAEIELHGSQCEK